MVGGATVGYCDTGSSWIDTTPAMITNMAITQAKIGRWMKNLDMRLLRNYWLAAADAD